MFSGGAGTPPGTRTTRRAASRRAVSSAFASGQTTPRASAPASTSRTLGANLHAAAAALSASPAPSRRAKSSVAALSDVGSAMDVDEAAAGRKEADKVLVKDENYAVVERKGLPIEVQQAISLADPYTQPVKAVLDPATGFALLVSSEHCFVWNWSQRSTSATTYVFPLPPQAPLPSNVKAYSPLSFASLVPSASQTHQQTQREPGLLVVSNFGSIRVWESVSMALSGVDRFKSTFATLNEGELIRDLKLLSPTAYLFSTSQSRIFVININSIGGRVEVEVRPLERAVGWAGSIWSSVFGTRTIDPRAGILALALSQSASNDGERTMYAVMEKSVQVWQVPSRGAGGERLVGEQDIFAGVLEALAGEKVGNEQWAMNEGRVEIVDAAVTADGHLAVLLSHIAPQTIDGFLSYAIVLLDVGSTPNSVAVAGLTHLSYQSRPDPRPLSTARLNLGPSDTAFVIFADAVVIASIANDAYFEEDFPLRHNTNRFLGISSPSYFSAAPSAHDSLSLLTSTSSILTVTVNLPQGHQLIAAGSEGYKTRKLKTKIEHAIYFGTGEAENPLAFDLQPDYEGDLAVAAEAVSAEILASSSPNMPLILDLRAQLADRAHRARALIEYINENGLIGKLPQGTRRQLSWNAERIAAAIALWHHQNARLGEKSILSEAILTFMDEVGEGFGEDPLRLFFRSKLVSLGNVIEEVSKQAKAVVSSTAAATEVKSPVLYEANQVAILVLTAVARHRKDTAHLYGLDSSAIPSAPWSSRPALLDGLQWHFDATDALLREHVRDFGAKFVEEQAKYGLGDETSQQAMQAELKKQMASVAEFVFSAFEERLLYLKTVNGDAVPSPESRVLTDRYLTLRPRFIRTLVSIDKVSSAFELAERHRDFRSLVELSTDEAHGSPSRVRLFLDKYAEDFAFPLYQFYLEKGQLRTLLEPDEAHRPLLTAFLDSSDHSRLSWLNDIAIGRYDHATEALVTEATKEQGLAQRKASPPPPLTNERLIEPASPPPQIMLSLGKLTQIAQVTRETLETEPVQRAIEVVDDNLDLVTSQQALRDVFASLLSGSESRLSPTQRGEAIVERAAPALKKRPAFEQLFAKLSARLFEGQALSAEDIIDLYTLKENVQEQAADFAAALEVLVRAKDLPQARKQIALESIWRRVYTQDDWASLRNAAGLSDEEMAEALRSTAFYATLFNVDRSSVPPSFFLDPSQSFSSATSVELAARHPDLPAPSLDLLLNDYEHENRALAEVVEQHGLEQYCKEIRRLLEEQGTTAAHGGEQGDEAMIE
ncbi:hypothetical protein JCM1841_005860 [Sporobolomyces salmonicolor]